VVVVAVVLLLVVARWIVLHRLPPADHPFTVDADQHQPMVEGDAIDRERRAIAERFVSLELLEKVVLIGLISFIFSRMLPGVDVYAVGILLGVAIVVVANTAISSALVRSGERPHGAVRQFVVTLAINVGIVLVGQLLVGALRATQLESALVFVLLLSLIVTCYDRYRPLYKARFANGPLTMPREPG
jgi:hypothetical protein